MLWVYEGTITRVLWDGPAFKAGMTPGMRLQAVNDQAFSIANLREAIATTEKGSAPIKLLLKRDKEFTTVTLPRRFSLSAPGESRVNPRSLGCHSRGCEIRLNTPVSE